MWKHALMAAGSRILVIKLGALGDFVQALGPFRAIRDHHPKSHITLLTTAAFIPLAEACGCFDSLWTDTRPGIHEPGQWLSLRNILRAASFKMVYDLQTSDRSSIYFRLFWPGPFPEWSGIASGCSHPHANPGRDFMHTIDRQAEQLKMAGIEETPPPDLSWASADVARFGIKSPYALLVPGGAAHRPAKRWPGFYDLARRLAESGITPVLIGAEDEAGIILDMARNIPTAVDLAGKTDFQDIAVLARDAVLAVGNDTGPMHLCAVAGCRSVVLFSSASNPSLCAPRGEKVIIIEKDNLSDLGIDEVWSAACLDTGAQGSTFHFSNSSNNGS